MQTQLFKALFDSDDDNDDVAKEPDAGVGCHDKANAKVSCGLRLPVAKTTNSGKKIKLREEQKRGFSDSQSLSLLLQDALPINDFLR